MVLASALPAAAGPIPTGTATVKSAAPSHLEGARWRGHWGGPGLAFGLAAGALVGAAVAARPYYYGSDYYYGGPVYADPYAYGPVYPAPRYYAPYGYYGYGGGCVSDDGYGRVGPCAR
jgi:hypothetical protein